MGAPRMDDGLRLQLLLAQAQEREREKDGFDVWR